MFFVGSCDCGSGKISSSEHRSRPASTKNLLAPLLSLLSFFFFFFIFHTLHSRWPSESSTVCLYVFLRLFTLIQCLIFFRTTVAPSPSWSLLSTTTSIWSWLRLRPTLPLSSTPALSTSSSTPLARSPPSRVPMASPSLRLLPLPSMVCEHFLPSMHSTTPLGPFLCLSSL